MDAHMRQSLDNYIMGVNLTRTELVWHKCPKCGFRREIGMMYDMGGWFYHAVEEEDKVECPECHIEMEVVDQQTNFTTSIIKS